MCEEKLQCKVRHNVSSSISFKKLGMKNEIFIDDDEIINLTKTATNNLNNECIKEGIEYGIESVFKKLMKGKHYKTWAKVLYDV